VGILELTFFHGALKYLEPNQGLTGTYLNLMVRNELAKLRK